MISRNSLGELADALRRAGVSGTSIDIACRILEDIGKLNPNEGLRNTIKDCLNEQGRYLDEKNSINLIPSDHKGACHDLLITMCAGESNFYLNTTEAIALCINCHRTIKAVIVLSDYWEEKQFNKWHKSTFKALHDQFGITFFIITPHGNRWTVNPIVL